MKFLIDTNIVIPLEPTSEHDFEVNTDLALKFNSLASQSGNTIYVHPEIHRDFQRDRDTARRTIRETSVQRYPALPYPPEPSILDDQIIQPSEHGSNSWVDDCLLASLQVDLIDHLVTEDIGIHRKARRLGLDSRVLRLNDAITLISDFFDECPPPPPTVESTYVHTLNANDSIFDSLRADYSGFDRWLATCRQEHRRAFVVKTETDEITAIVIIKPEERLPNGQSGKVLKICTFKVSETHGGNRLGELLLKPIFEYVETNNYEYAYFTAYPKQTHLIEFANSFGFEQITNNVSSEELALCKSFKFNQAERETLAPLDFHIKYGSRQTSFNGNKSFIVPIIPQYHTTLFPDLSPTPLTLFQPTQRPCGNSIKKAYLCHAPTNLIKEGDNLLFYRSSDFKALTCIGIVERTLRSSDPNKIAQFVGKRTVYSFAEIQQMCASNSVLAITFRFVRPFDSNIPLVAMRLHGILSSNSTPQSIITAKESGVQWLRQQLGM